MPGAIRQGPDKAKLMRRLELIFDWYQHMMDRETGKLVYV